MKRIIILSLTALLFAWNAQAQAWKHELAVKAGGGLSSLQYDPTEGEQVAGTGYMFGLGYSYFFTPNWGISTGAEMGYYTAKGALANYTNNIFINLNDGNSFDFISTYSDYDEEVNTFLINIPLMAQYQSPSIDGNKSLYVSLGGKVGIPISGKNHTTGTLTTVGYSPSLNVTYEDIPDRGFVNNRPVNHEQDLDLKVAIMASAEVGIKWRLGEKTNLYSGIYFDWGLNDISKDKQPLVDYQPANPSVLSYSNMGSSLSSSVTPLTIGITLRFAFGLMEFPKPKPKTT